MTHKSKLWQLLHNYIQKKQTNRRTKIQKKGREKEKENKRNYSKRKEEEIENQVPLGRIH